MEKKIVNTSATRKANQRLILEMLRARGPMSVADIAKVLDVPAGTIARVTNALTDLDLLKTTINRRKKRVGKPPVLITINESYASLIGVELNELVIRILLTDFKGKVLKERVVKTDRNTANVVPCQLAEVIREVISSSGKSCGPLKGIGLAVSGLVDPDTTKVIHGFLPHGLDIGKPLEKIFKVPVLIGNDANLAALAEASFGLAKSYTNIVSLLDRGWIGAGLIFNGKLYMGKNSKAGELTAGIHVNNTVKKNLKTTEFPFIESYGLERRIRESGFNEHQNEDFTARGELIEFICKKARKGNKKALNLITDEVESFAVAIFRLCNFLDPELFIIQGDVTAAGTETENRILDKLKEICDTSWLDFPLPQVKFSRMSQNVVALGAVSMTIDALIEQAI